MGEIFKILIFWEYLSKEIYTLSLSKWPATLKIISAKIENTNNSLKQSDMLSLPSFRVVYPTGHDKHEVAVPAAE